MKSVIQHQPFEKPTFLNEKEALIIHLELNNDCESDLDSVVEICKTLKKHRAVNSSPCAPLVGTNIFTFLYSNYLYQVSLLNGALKSDISVSFNSKLFGIKEIGNPLEKSKILGVTFASFSNDLETCLGQIPSLYKLRKIANDFEVSEIGATDIKQAISLMDKEKETARRLVLSLWDGQVLAEWE
jgi:hypothetical protein